MNRPLLSSLVIPVYRNAPTIGGLIDAIAHIDSEVPGQLETIFVVDGSPDDSRELLASTLAGRGLRAQIVEHSRNFGSFAAIRTGMRLAQGQNIAVMAADLQEPPELIIEFLRRLQTGTVDVLAGERASRADRDTASRFYWRLYRRFVLGEMPPEGVDVFACTASVRDVICSMEGVHTSLVAQLFWVGFRRQLVPYNRQPRPGESGWTLSKKLRYLSDSVFAFTDLPVRILWIAGSLGLALGVLVGILVLVARATGTISVPGYAPTILAIAFFGSLNLLGLGIIGSYVWRAYENTKRRPDAIVRDVMKLTGEDVNG